MTEVIVEGILFQKATVKQASLKYLVLHASSVNVNLSCWLCNYRYVLN